ncbi:MAG: hypothetical protein GC192_16630 [Bacteroidetes bacterium]|nr:hypothetical protein [Bacteroidota bacterium]
MEKIKLYQLLSALTSEDLKAAKKFLASPFHNTDPLMGRYFDHLRKFHPTMNDDLLKNEAVFKHLFPKQYQYDEKKLRNLRHKLTQLLESFLAHHSLQEEQAIQSRLLVGALGNRNAYSLFKKEIEAQTALLEKADNRSLDYFREMAWLQHSLYFHPETESFENNQTPFSAIDHFEKYFSLSLLCYAAEMNARKKIINEDWQPCFLPEALNKAALQFAPDNRLVELYQQLLSSNEQSLEDLKSALESCEPLMGKFEFGIAWKMLLNKAISLSNRGSDKTTSKMLHGLYQIGITKGLFYDKEARNVIRFINIAQAATLAGEYEWARAFVEQYKVNLEDSERENIELFCLAHLHYHRGRQYNDFKDFAVALDHLAKINHIPDLIEFRMRILQLRAMYDSLSIGPDILPTLLSYTKNFQSYILRNNSLASNRIQAYLSFIKFFKVLTKLKMSNQTSNPTLSSFQKELEGSKEVALKSWLMERANELEK